MKYQGTNELWLIDTTDQGTENSPKECYTISTEYGNHIAYVKMGGFEDEENKDFTLQEGESHLKLLVTAPELLKELIRLQSDQPRHPMHPESKFTCKREYDKAYKKWRRTQDIIDKAID